MEAYGIRMEIGRRQLERVDMLLQSQQHAMSIADFKSRFVQASAVAVLNRSCIQDMTDAANAGSTALEHDGSAADSVEAVSLSAMPASTAATSSTAASSSISPPSVVGVDKDWGIAWLSAAGLDFASP